MAPESAPSPRQGSRSWEALKAVLLISILALVCATTGLSARTWNAVKSRDWKDVPAVVRSKNTPHPRCWLPLWTTTTQAVLCHAGDDADTRSKISPANRLPSLCNACTAWKAPFVRRDQPLPRGQREHGALRPDGCESPDCPPVTLHARVNRSRGLATPVVLCSAASPGGSHLTEAVHAMEPIV